MSLLIYGAILSVLWSPMAVLSNSVLNRVEVIRHAGSPPSADAFSNPGCHASYCNEQGTFCYTDCCKCQCDNNKPNYIVNKWECVSRDELNQMSSTQCKYSILKPSQPLLSLPLTEVMSQKVSFTDTDEHRTVIPCNDSIQITWKYRDAFGEWKEGEGNIFEVENDIKPHPVTPSIRDQRVITKLKWTGSLRSEYSGLLIKFLFKCEGKLQGCALAKISGNHTYDTTKLATVRPPPVIDTTARTPETTTASRVQTNTNAYQQGGTNQASTKGNPAAIFGPILGVLGLICLIGVVCVVAARYRRRRRNQGHETNSVEKLEEYQDPIYADINKGDFDNPVYCDPAMNPANIRKQLGPLPKIPGSESPYEPLNSMTRTSPDYDNPVNGAKPEADYDNPPVKMETTSDYDNPPVKGGMEDTGDYDNPPVKDGMENTGDYDNPPVKGIADINQDNDNPSDSGGEDTSF